MSKRCKEGVFLRPVEGNLGASLAEDARVPKPFRVERNRPEERTSESGGNRQESRLCGESLAGVLPATSGQLDRVRMNLGPEFRILASCPHSRSDAAALRLRLLRTDVW